MTATYPVLETTARSEGAIVMNIQRVFTGTQDFKSLILHQIEKEIEKIVSDTYNNKQVDIVAINNGGRQE